MMAIIDFTVSDMESGLVDKTTPKTNRNTEEHKLTQLIVAILDLSSQSETLPKYPADISVFINNITDIKTINIPKDRKSIRLIRSSILLL